MNWIKLANRMPNPDEHERVLIYTEGYDFNGEQVFDVKAESLNEWFYADPEDQPEVCRHASHWATHPIDGMEAETGAQFAEAEAGAKEVLVIVDGRIVRRFHGPEARTQATEYARARVRNWLAAGAIRKVEIGQVTSIQGTFTDVFEV